MEIVDNKEEQKPTYDELMEAHKNLFSQAQQMAKRLQEVEQFLASKRVEYLFDIIKNKGSFDIEYVKKAVNEIQESMFPKTESE